MVAPRRTKKVFCTVVRVPVTENTRMSTQPRFSSRPSDLIPWADPYIAQLVTNLQREVRRERTKLSESFHSSGVVEADLEPPSPSTSDFEWEWTEDNRWPVNDDA